MTTTRKPAPDTREVLMGERSKLAKLQDDQAAAAAELDDLQACAGDLVVDEPAAAGRVARDLAELRDRVEIGGRAVDAQRSRVGTAEKAFLLAEAEAHRGPASSARRKLERHQARTEELLKLLAEHDGSYVPKAWLDSQLVAAGTPRVLESYVGDGLSDAVERAELPVLVLEEMAAGRAPEAHERLRGVDPTSVYPSTVWGQEAVVPAPAWLRRVEAEQHAAAGTAAGIDKLSELVADLEAAIAAGDEAPTDLQTVTLAKPPTLPKQLEHARRALAELQARAGAGSPAAPAAI